MIASIILSHNICFMFKFIVHAVDTLAIKLCLDMRSPHHLCVERNLYYIIDFLQKF